MTRRIVKPNLKWANNDYQVALVPSRIDGIALHHMAHPTWNLQEVHQGHINRGWSGIGYNYWIAFDGTIYEGRGKWQGAGISGHNTHLVHIGFQGNFHPSNTTKYQTEMSDTQYNAGVWLIGYLKSMYPNAKTVDGHKRWQANACPGNYFPLEEMKSLKYRGEDELDMDYKQKVDDLLATWAGFIPEKNAMHQEIKILKEKLAQYESQEVATWAKDAVEWVQDEKLILGSDKGFDPNKPITRQELATILHRAKDKKVF